MLIWVEVKKNSYSSYIFANNLKAQTHSIGYYHGQQAMASIFMLFILSFLLFSFQLYCSCRLEVQA